MITFQDKEWAPTEFTPPLSYPFDSDGPGLIDWVHKNWRTLDGKLLTLDEPQQAMLNHLLERLPSDDPFKRGPLRFRRGILSMGRQNGKSELAAILSVYALTGHAKGPVVIGVASSADQANIVYKRAAYNIKGNKKLSRKIKTTGTRGLYFLDGSGSYQMKASKGEALQGLDISFGICDELHIMKPEVWDSLVVGQKARDKSLLIGITTAGDEQSELLKRLYEQGRRVIAEPDENNQDFGFWLWEAPADSTIEDGVGIKIANPSVMCGRVPVQRAINDINGLPVADQTRYGLNRFVASLQSWIQPKMWYDLDEAEVTPGKDLIFSVDKHGGNENSPDYVTITASQRNTDETISVNVIADLVTPSFQVLLDKCVELAQVNIRATFVMDGKSMSALGKALRDQGYEVYLLTSTEIMQACTTVLGLIKTNRIKRDDYPTLMKQIPMGRAKTLPDGWAIDRRKSAGQVDALMSMMMGVYLAEIMQKKTLQFSG